jgi:flagellar biosynthetic protein FlhB
MARPEVTAGGLPDLWAPLEPGLLAAIGGIVAPIALVALAVGLFQSRGRLTLSAMRPNPGRLNPIGGMRRLVSSEALVGLGWPLVKLAVLALVVQAVARGVVAALPGAIAGGVPAQMGALGDAIVAVARDGTGAMALLAVGDAAYRRRQFMNRARMTRQEVREELRESEGDPMIRARLRALRRARARRRMLHQVPKAKVVVVNPTHFAVALAYDHTKMAAPEVVAKGADFLAQKIIQIARESRVPVVTNPPLARSLYQSVELGEPIPIALYEAIAEILAHVYSLRRRS